MQKLIFTPQPAGVLRSVIEELNPTKVFVLADTNTSKFCMPHLGEVLAESELIIIGAGDEHKNIATLENVWSALQDGGATRSSLLVNVGGGMVTDLGGFAASTFKRGMKFFNLPTTVLSAVDAAVGGKTGINFRGLKNEIGVFCQADAVIVSSAFYPTLPAGQILSGYGEVLKHALLDSPEATAKALAADPAEMDAAQLGAIVEESVRIKERIVESDPFEKGMRKALNLGHTVAHAFEALALSRGEHLDHGVAVAYGLVTDMVLSNMRLGFPSAVLHQVSSFVKSYYPAFSLDCRDYPKIVELMRHDKKNSTPDAINFTLLRKPGDVAVNTVVGVEDIGAALDITRDLL